MPQKEKDQERPAIICKKDGPYLVKNLVHLTGVDGQSVDAKSTIALCRHARRCIPDRWSKYLTRMNEAGVERADGNLM